MTEQTPRITRKVIIGCTAAVLELNRDEVIGPRRDRKFVRGRWIIATLLREFQPSISLPEIGHTLGGRDHTTVIHALRSAERMAKYNPEFASLLDACRQRVLAWRPSAPPTVVFTAPPPEPALELKSQPAVKCEPPAPVPIVRHRKTRYGTEFYGGDTDSQWYAANDRRFRAAMLKAHPERAPVGMREAAE